MNGKVNDKIKKIEEYLSELESVKVGTFEEYEKSIMVRATYERYFEKIVETLIDLAFIIVNEKGFKKPEEEEGAFKVLVVEKIISKSLYLRLAKAKGMRNFIVHQYEKINNLLVYTAVEEELIDDAREFIECIRRME